MGSIITGVGAYLPEKVLTNFDLASKVDTSDDWIIERTGIKQRHIAAKSEFTSDLAHNAAMQALSNAGRKATDIDLIIVATSTPDLTFPSTANILAGKLGVSYAPSFDINAACSGFVYALSIADGMLKSGAAKCALVVGAETYSRIVDWTDRNTCVLFGDGAGAVLLEADGEEGRGILYSRLYSDGAKAGLLETSGGVSASQTAGVVKMAGKEVFRHAVEKMSGSLMQALDSLEMPVSAIDWLVPHQANLRIINAIADRTGIDPERVIITIDRHANTSAASIPLALAAGISDGRIIKNNIIALLALGAGLTWGAVVIKL